MAFVSDTFTDTDGVLLQNHTPDVGGAWEALDFSWPSLAATTLYAAINTNRARAAASSTRIRAYRNATAPATNEYDVQAIHTLTTAGTNVFAGLLGRMTPTGVISADVDRYRCVYNFHGSVGSRAWSLAKVVSGTQTVLDSLTEDIGAGTHTIKLEVRTATKRAFLGAVQKLSSADDAITQVGRAGIGIDPTQGVNNYTDDFSATDVAGGTDRRGRVSWAEFEVANAPRMGRASWIELEVPTAPRRGRTSWLELEVPTAPRRGRASWIELEVPVAPRQGRLSWAEFEVPERNRTGRLSWVELETPLAPRRGRLSQAEFETPNAPRRGRLSWVELETPLADRRGRLSWIELEAPLAPRRGRLSWAEMEVGLAPRRGRVSQVEFEIPDANRRGRLSWLELETPNAPRRGRLSWTEFEVPENQRRGRTSWLELELPLAPRRGRLSQLELEVPLGARRGRVSFLSLEVPQQLKPAYVLEHVTIIMGLEADRDNVPRAHGTVLYICRDTVTKYLRRPSDADWIQV